MTTWKLLVSYWSFDPFMILICTALILGYLALENFRISRSFFIFSTGVLLLLLSTSSPLNILGKNYLFSASMILHIILLLVIPLMLLLGLSAKIINKSSTLLPSLKIFNTLERPVVAWILGVGTMWIWHAPIVHNYFVVNYHLHIVQIFVFLLIGSIFWLPVFSPIEERRLSPLSSTLYLSSACLSCTVLGILITFANAGLYREYINPVDTLGILNFLRNDLCITPSVDQQIGGLTMWVPGCLIYLVASMITIARWYREPEKNSGYMIQDTNTMQDA